MTTLLQSLPAEIQRLEKKHGSDNPFVISLKEQLRAMKETEGKSTREVWMTSAQEFKPVTPAQKMPKQLHDLQNLPEDPVLGAVRANEAAFKARSRPAIDGIKWEAEAKELGPIKMP